MKDLGEWDAQEIFNDWSLYIPEICTKTCERSVGVVPMTLQ